MAVDEVVDVLKEHGTALVHEKAAGILGSAGGIVASSAIIGTAATWLNLPVEKALQEPLLIVPLTSIVAIGYGIATFFAHEKRISEFRMYEPGVSNMRAEHYDGCEGKKTNTAHYAAILVSSYTNSDENRDAVLWHFNNKGILLENLLKKHEEKGNPFLGAHKIAGGYVVNGAKRTDLEEAIRDPQVSSIALIGHSSRGRWAATEEDVSWKNVAEMVKKAGHCKDGFGLQMGCNVVFDKEKDRHPVLTPAFHGHGQGNQIGYLYFRKGEAYNEDSALPGSESTSTNYVKALRINLTRLVHNSLPS